MLATMAVVVFDAVCPYNDVSHLRWRNIKFELDGSSFEITFEKRKNAQFLQGKKVVVAVAKPGVSICPLLLLKSLQSCYLRHDAEDDFVSRGFNGHLVQKSWNKTKPYTSLISYDQHARYLALWCGGVMGISPDEFRKQFGTSSGRSGAASAPADAPEYPLSFGANMVIGPCMKHNRCT